MGDIYIDLLMHGQIISGKSKLAPETAKEEKDKDKFELAEDQLIDNFIDSSPFIEDPSKNLLTPYANRRAKRKEELKADSHSLNNRDLHLEVAFNILSKEGLTYVDEEKYKEMIAQFSQISFYLEQIDFSKSLKEKLTILLHISESTMETILKVALAKYQEMQYEASLPIFSLLTSLNSENELYRYQMGIVASQLEQLDLALEAFGYALYLSPDFLEARIFSAECYFKLGKLDDAKAELEEANKIVKRSSPEQVWLDLLAKLEEEIK